MFTPASKRAHHQRFCKVACRIIDEKLRNKFGIGIEDYRFLLEEQRGVCAICKNPCVSGNRLCLDHDHKTNQIRGLLCGRCNRTLGLVEDRIDLLGEFISYLQART